MKSRLIISYALYCVGITFRLLNRARLDNVSVGKLAFLQSKESREKKNWSEVPALWRIWLWQLQVHSHLSRNSREEPARAFSEIRDLQRNKSTDLSGARDVAVFVVLCALLAPVAADLHAVNCSQVKDAFTDLGYSPANVPTEESAGIDWITTLLSSV